MTLPLGSLIRKPERCVRSSIVVREDLTADRWFGSCRAFHAVAQAADDADRRWILRLRMISAVHKPIRVMSFTDQGDGALYGGDFETAAA